MKRYLVIAIAVVAASMVLACGDEISLGEGYGKEVCLDIGSEEFCGKRGDGFTIQCAYLGPDVSGDPESCSDLQLRYETGADGRLSTVFNGGSYVTNEPVINAGFFVTSFLDEGFYYLERTEIIYNSSFSSGKSDGVYYIPSVKFGFKRMQAIRPQDLFDDFGSSSVSVEIVTSYYNLNWTAYPLDPALESVRLINRGVLRFTLKKI